jgi:hypothetical protein
MATNAPATKKSNKGRKSAAIALAIVGVAGLSLASAAQLNINASSLGAGNSIVTACQSTQITVAFAPTYTAASLGYEATKVTLGAIAATCNNYSYSVRATGALGVALGTEATGNTLALASIDVSLVGVKASDVTGVSVVFYK